jgi:hypothetical protein
MQPFVLLAMSQFLFFYEQHIPTQGDVLVNLLNNELTPENKPAVEACILGLNTLSGYMISC